ncbi:T9SS type B sorting domain-containing protein [Maribacter litopenaei]|uniref:T9SS type B sorting domain-containing protein n=1 Tax=Maribacter litopenaei TaxID=2976127 RepID=A0ABY5Y764_9FLAO|nr:T9SS type B sorting domain-containing protein [Maribacter litopenaei]UWX54708.1 T9SS type B sorting domain-containing protein [Maribacter litopenaei]
MKLSRGGAYSIYIRDKTNCGTINIDYLHIVMPAFFTPNGDNYYDLFIPEGIESFNEIELSIYDRYGKLLKFAGGSDASWDGTFLGAPMPSDDYWYNIKLDTLNRKGHFSLKR